LLAPSCWGCNDVVGKLPLCASAARTLSFTPNQVTHTRAHASIHPVPVLGVSPARHLPRLSVSYFSVDHQQVESGFQIDQTRKGRARGIRVANMLRHGMMEQSKTVHLQGLLHHRPTSFDDNPARETSCL